MQEAAAELLALGRGADAERHHRGRYAGAAKADPVGKQQRRFSDKNFPTPFPTTNHPDVAIFELVGKTVVFPTPQGGAMALIGYLRVSKADGSQSTDLQRDALMGAGVLESFIYEDYASGKRDDRPGLEACLKALRAGDTLVVWKLDRLGRSLPHLVQTVYDLQLRDVGFTVLTGAPIDTSTKEGKLMFSLFAGLAECERELIRERTLEGMKAARARGRKSGRPPAMTKAKILRAQAAMKDNTVSVSELARELEVNKDTLYQYVGPGGVLRELGLKVMG
jgi:DNA invertase Pin-like site-specific DNA recombinase